MGYPRKHANYLLCQAKYQALSHFLQIKSETESRQQDIVKYDLHNSVVPAIQNHLMITMKVPLYLR